MAKETKKISFDQKESEIGFLGREGESLWRSIECDVSSVLSDRPSATFIAEYRRGLNETPFKLNSALSGNTLTVELNNISMAFNGSVYLQIVAVDGDEIGRSKVFRGHCEYSIVADGHTPESPYDDALVDIHQSIKKVDTAIESISPKIQQSLQESKDSGMFDGYTPQRGVDYWTAQDKIEMSADVEKIADRAEESAVKSEKSAEKSKTSADKSNQNLTDLIAMIGTDVASLVGGKIPMSQIPATATVENFEITSEDQLTTLIAQKGDNAYLVHEINGEKTIVKVWQLLGGNDPAVRENWVVWGTSYAVQAGSAAIAENANNSERINNMRLVTMKYSDYQTAVKDPNTIYAVDMEA